VDAEPGEGSAVYERVMHVAASPETVFELLTDPVAFSSWMGIGVEFDARPGGAVRIDLGVAVRGEVVEVVPGRRVVFTWGWEGDRVPLPPGSSEVAFELVAEREGTTVRLRHSGLHGALRAFHAYGWSLFLPRLVEVAQGRDAGAWPLTPETAAEALAILRPAR